MTKLPLWLIGIATPRDDREWIVGDTVEEFGRVAGSLGPAAARRWLWGEMWRVLAAAPRHRLAARRRPGNRVAARGDETDVRDLAGCPVRRAAVAAVAWIHQLSQS